MGKIGLGRERDFRGIGNGTLLELRTYLFQRLPARSSSGQAPGEPKVGCIRRSRLRGSDVAG